MKKLLCGLLLCVSSMSVSAYTLKMTDNHWASATASYEAYSSYEDNRILSRVWASNGGRITQYAKSHRIELIPEDGDLDRKVFVPVHITVNYHTTDSDRGRGCATLYMYDENNVSSNVLTECKLGVKVITIQMKTNTRYRGEVNTSVGTIDGGPRISMTGSMSFDIPNETGVIEDDPVVDEEIDDINLGDNYGNNPNAPDEPSIPIVVSNYSGIWTTEGAGTFSLHDKDGYTIALRLNDYGDYWEAFSGQLSNGRMIMSSIDGYSGVNAVFEVIFTSETTFRAKQISCVPNYSDFICEFPNGAIVYGNKIF